MSKLEDEESWSLLAQSTTESTLAIANYIRTIYLAVGYGVGVVILWSLGGVLQVSDALYCDFDYDLDCALVIPEYLVDFSGAWVVPQLLAVILSLVGIVHLGKAFSEATRFRQLATATVSIDD
jgi:hypothetical protein